MTWANLSSPALFEALPTPAIVLSVDGTVVAANQSAEKLFEREMSSAGLTVMELLAQPERTRLDPLAWMQKWADAPNAPELDYVYLSCRTASGKEKQLSVRVARMSSDGEAYFLVTMHDVSLWESRLHSEREAHRIAARVLAISADAVIIVDENFVVTYANRSAYKLFGYDNGKLIDLPLADLIPPRYRGEHDSFITQFGKEVTPARLMGERGPIVALTKDGREVAVEASIARITIKGKQVYSAHLREKTPARIDA